MNLLAGEQRSKAYLAVNPQGKVPAIQVRGKNSAKGLSQLLRLYNPILTGPYHSVLLRVPSTKAPRIAQLFNFKSTASAFNSEAAAGTHMSALVCAIPFRRRRTA